MKFTEKCNEERIAIVLNSSNLPQQEKDLSVKDLEWFNSFKKTFTKYSDKIINKDGYRTIEYTQPIKNTRLMSNGGIQSFQKEIRSYILTGNDGVPLYKDIDIVNCHPILLEQLYEKFEVSKPEFLILYNADRQKTIKKYKLGDKRTVLKIINDSTLYHKEKKISEFHNSLYNILIPKLKKLPDFKCFIKKKQNSDGTFISHVLQYYENIILNNIVKSIRDRGGVVGILMFDGCMIENNGVEINLEDIEEEVRDNCGFDITLSEKSVETDWVPNNDGEGCFEKSEEDQDREEYDIEYSASLVDDQEKLINYLNNYLCRFDNPQAYGWRRFKNEDFLVRNNVSVEVGVKQLSIWNNSNIKKCLRGLKFNVEGEVEGYHNMYKRPLMSEGSTPELFLSFIKEVICSGDEKVFKYMEQYIHTIIKTGKTRQCIVLMGLKGTGKSTFIDLIADLISKDYYSPVNDICRLTSNFNSAYEKSILIGVEEVVSSAGEYHKVQNTLKSLITEDFKTIEKKGVDSYNIDCYNNYIISTNGFNPVQVTEDNRRFMILDVSSNKKGDVNYFKQLKQYTKDNLEQIRHYFYNLEYSDSLQENRPTTSKELELLELNITITDRFIRDELVIEGVETHNSRKYTDIYNNYTMYCQENGENKQSAKYFTQALLKSGYRTIRKKQGKLNNTFVV